MSSTSEPAAPDRDCPLCPRLAAFREHNRVDHPDWYNAPVPSFGPADVRLLVVGLAPGLKGANRTGRPFTGDYAGELLYKTLCEFGLAKGRYEQRIDDGLKLIGCRITNAVRCVPPENKPLPAEVRTCRRFLEAEIGVLPQLRAILVLGRIAHDATLAALGLRPAQYRFGHGAIHHLPSGVRLIDSYHCSRYNTQTGVLTEAMFRKVIETTRDTLGGGPGGGGPLGWT